MMYVKKWRSLRLRKALKTWCYCGIILLLGFHRKKLNRVLGSEVKTGEERSLFLKRCSWISISMESSRRDPFTDIVVNRCILKKIIKLRFSQVLFSYTQNRNRDSFFTVQDAAFQIHVTAFLFFSHWTRHSYKLFCYCLISWISVEYWGIISRVKTLSKQVVKKCEVFYW